MEKVKVTVPLVEILEILRLSTDIEHPTAVFKKDDNLAMANEVIERSISKAGQISSIIYKWTH